MTTPARLNFTFDTATLEEFAERYAVDMTRTGFFLRAENTLPVGTEVEFALRLKGGAELISGRGTVAWIKQAEGEGTGGMGLRFDKLPLKARKTLDRILKPQDALDTLRERVSGSYPRIDPSAGRREASEAAIILKPSTGETLAVGGARDVDYVPPPTRERPPTGPAWMAGEEEDDDGPGAGALSWLLLAVVIGVAGYGAWYFMQEEGQPKPTVAAPPPAPAFADGGASAPARAVSLKVVSHPPGAKILVDGKDTGKVAPAEIDGLDPRVQLEIALQLPGRSIARQKLKPSAGTVLRANLRPLARLLRIESIPPKASVTLDGRAVGETPCEVPAKRLRRPQHQLKLRLAGHRDQEHLLSPAELSWQRRGDDAEVALFKVKLSKQ